MAIVHSIGHKAVSYTHLDVYKRQVSSLCRHIVCFLTFPYSYSLCQMLYDGQKSAVSHSLEDTAIDSIAYFNVERLSGKNMECMYIHRSSQSVPFHVVLIFFIGYWDIF